MCKIFALAGINTASAPAAYRLLRAIREPLTVSDKDGFGYAALSKSGNISAERWLYPTQAFSLREDPIIPDGLESMLKGSAIKRYTRHGPLLRSLQNHCAVIAHARMATCGVTINNVHPFIRQVGGRDIALIHNGVVGTDGMDLTGSDNCDSAGILNAYAKERVDMDETRFPEVAKDLAGWYACAVLGNTADGTPYLDIFKEPTSSLYAAVIQNVGVTWCTRLDIVFAACKAAGLQVQGTWEVKHSQLVRLHARTGAVLSTVPFKPSKKALWRRTGGGGVKNWPWTFNEKEQSWSRRIPEDKIDGFTVRSVGHEKVKCERQWKGSL